MTYNFCTLFDSNYLSRGIALYRSLEKHCNNFHLYIFAFDTKSYNVLKKLNLVKATVIPLSEFEDEKLLQVKPSRSVAEYCWTSTSSTILYVLENFGVDNCTYVDADVFFYSSPEPIFQELGDKSILITEHRYSPQYNKELKSGKYCVQFITFRNDENGLKALRWWRDRCLEWCYARYEDGKFGDQLYLDDWTERFQGVHVMQHLGGGLAAWNVQQYEFQKVEEKILGKENSTGQEFDVIFYHFHYLKFFNDGKVELGRRKLSKQVINIFYKDYIKLLDDISSEIKKYDSSMEPNGTIIRKFNWKTPLLYIYRKIYGVYNIFDKSKLFENNG
ncbi:glycosyl transferase [Ignavibacterium album]|uniref:glycosyl transferase n=1 Tax=Ignavibacterium album TaxID=591197 RepID=UPI0035BA3202